MIAIENMLRDRLLMRKEMKIELLEKRLSEVSHELHKAEQKLKGYESLIGLRELLKICNTCEQWIRYLNGTNSDLSQCNNETNVVIGGTLALIGRALIHKSAVIGGLQTCPMTSSEVIRLGHGVLLAILLTMVPEWLNIFIG